MIGDGRSAALVDRCGSLSWLAWPEFDSPAVLAGILDPARGGHLTVRPEGSAAAGRAYLDGTNVLATRFETERGALRVLDFMVLAGEAELRRRAFPGRVAAFLGPADARPALPRLTQKVSFHTETVTMRGFLEPIRAPRVEP